MYTSNFNNFALSPKSITAKALKAAAEAEVRSKANKEQSNNKVQSGTKTKRQKPLPEIERDVLAIKEALEAKSPSYKVRIEKPGRFSSAYSVICLYSCAELQDQEEDEKKDKEAMKAGGASEGKAYRPRLVKPTITYVFFASVLSPHRLGSVAIYGPGAVGKATYIRNKGNLYGIPVESVNIEMGARPFVDVKIRP